MFADFNKLYCSINVLNNSNFFIFRFVFFLKLFFIRLSRLLSFNRLNNQYDKSIVILMNNKSIKGLSNTFIS